MPTQTFFSVIPRVDVSPGATGSWQTVDLSAYLPAGATGAIFKVQNTTAANTPFGLRKNGSTDNRTYSIRGSTNPPYWTSAAIGVDANRVCQLYRGNSGIHFFLIGYTTAGVAFFTNATQFDVGSNSTWLDIDVSSVVPAGALGVILEICETGGTTNNGAGARNNGSTQNKTGTFGHAFAIIGCDANRLIEGYKGTAGFRWYVLGYITAGVTFFVNPTGIIISNQNANGSVMDYSGTAPAGTLWFLCSTGVVLTDFTCMIRKDVTEPIDSWSACLFGVFLECSVTRTVLAYDSENPGYYPTLYLEGYAEGPLPSYKDVPTLFKLTTARFKDIATLFKLSGSADCETLVPASDGDLAELYHPHWPTNNPNHYLGVIAQGDADTVDNELAIWKEDLYHFSQLTRIDTGPLKIILAMWCWGNNFSVHYRQDIKIAGVDYEVTGDINFPYYTSPAFKYLVLYNSPATGLPWSIAEIQTMQVGVKIYDSGIPSGGVVDQYFVRVTWVNAAVRTDPYANYTGVAVDLNGTVLQDECWPSCQVRFNWGLTVSYGNNTTYQSKSKGQTFTAHLAGLDPTKVYHYRTEIVTPAGETFYGGDMTFPLLPGGGNLPDILVKGNFI